jgi:hypothetical protein
MCERAIMDYDIIIGFGCLMDEESKHDFVREVRRAILRHDWEPLGPPIALGKSRVIQAMVKRTECLCHKGAS